LALIGGSGSSGLQAQEGYSYKLKIRVGLTAGDIVKTHDDNKVMAFAAEVKREMPMLGNGAALFGEVSWEYVPGRHYDAYPWEENPIVPFGPGLNYWGENKLDPRYTFDDRKEYGQGFSLRLGYCAPMPQFGPEIVQNALQKMEWFGGLGFDRHKVRSEVHYTINLTPVTQNPAAGMYDGGTFEVENATLAPGVFAGIRYAANEDIGFEMSVRNFGMAHYEYTPAAYLTRDPNQFGGVGATSKTGTSRGWALEFSITAKI
jgi:hypothetical protein